MVIFYYFLNKMKQNLKLYYSIKIFNNNTWNRELVIHWKHWVSSSVKYGGDVQERVKNNWWDVAIAHH